MPFITNLNKHHRVNELRRRVEAGELAIPQINPSDTAAIAALPPDQLELVAAGIFAHPDTDSPDLPPLPQGWDMAALRRLQGDHPDNWRAILDSLAG